MRDSVLQIKERELRIQILKQKHLANRIRNQHELLELHSVFFRIYPQFRPFYPKNLRVVRRIGQCVLHVDICLLFSCEVSERIKSLGLARFNLKGLHGYLAEGHCLEVPRCDIGLEH